MADLSDVSRRALHRILVDRQAEHRVPGLYGSVARRGETLWGAGVGSADLASPGVPPTADSQFLIASLSKTFTAVLMMALRDEGKLSLDDGVDQHVQGSRHGGVTIRQMLSHVTGMQREPVGDVWDTLTYPDRAELVDGWNEAERILRPHHRWHYSNLAYSMLGEIVSRLDGRDWAESLRARILDPLGMPRTSVGLSDGAAARGYYVPPFSDVPVVEPVLDIEAMASAGGLASTANDLTTWAAFLADPADEVLSADTLEEMCQPQIMADLETWQVAWGLGLMLLRHQDHIFVGHTGAMPGHITGLFVQRQASTAGVVLMNSTSAPDPAAFAVELATYVLDNEPAEQELWTPGTEVPDELEGLLGRWFSEGQPFAFTVRKGRLEARSEAAPDKPPSVFVKIADDLYRTESGRETGELLRITRNDEGTVTKMNWATYLVTREPYAFGEWLTSAETDHSGDVSSSSSSS